MRGHGTHLSLLARHVSQLSWRLRRLTRRGGVREGGECAITTRTMVGVEMVAAHGLSVTPGA